MRIHTLSLVARDSPETNDHQLRPFIDGNDWLGDDQLGLDPPKFFRQSALRSEGELLVGRCECGVIGCDDRAVIVERGVNFVFWRSGSGHDVQFAQPDYDAELERAANDFTWESVGRTAERLVDAALLGTETSDGYTFRWSSTRIRPATLTLCFERNGDQRLTDVRWNGKADEGLVAAARDLIPRLGCQVWGASHHDRPESTKFGVPATLIGRSLLGVAKTFSSNTIECSKEAANI